MKRALLNIFAALTVCAAISSAAVPDRDWPGVAVTPIMDVSMRDTAITRSPDGIWKLSEKAGMSPLGSPMLEGGTTGQ